MVKIQCEDYLLFQKYLKKLRDIDDKIIYALNQSTPTVSIQARGVSAQEKCQELRKDLTESHKQREYLINECINEMGAAVTDLKSAYTNGNKNLTGEIQMKSSQLRMYENELNIEEIIQDRTEKVFKSKCQEYL